MSVAQRQRPKQASSYSVLLSPIRAACGENWKQVRLAAVWQGTQTWVRDSQRCFVQYSNWSAGWFRSGRMQGLRALSTCLGCRRKWPKLGKIRSREACPDFGLIRPRLPVKRGRPTSEPGKRNTRTPQRLEPVSISQY